MLETTMGAVLDGTAEPAMKLQEVLSRLLKSPEDLHSLRIRPARYFSLGRTPRARNLEVFLQDRFTCVDVLALEKAIETGYLDSFARDVLERLHRKWSHHTEQFTYGQVLREEEALLRSLIQPEDQEMVERDLEKELREAFPGSAPEGRPLMAAHHAFLIEKLTTYLVWRIRGAAEDAPAAAGRKKKEKRNG